MPLEHGDRPWREDDAPVVARLGDVHIHPRDPRLRDAERPVRPVVVRHEERDLLGRPQPREEPKLIIVSLRLTPIPMERRNELLGLLDAERIDDRPVPLIDASAFEAPRRGRLYWYFHVWQDVTAGVGVPPWIRATFPVVGFAAFAAINFRLLERRGQTIGIWCAGIAIVGLDGTNKGAVHLLIYPLCAGDVVPQRTYCGVVFHAG